MSEGWHSQTQYIKERGATYIYSCMDVSDGTLFISTPCLAGMFPHRMYIAEDMPAIEVFEQIAHILNVFARKIPHSVSIMLLLCNC